MLVFHLRETIGLGRTKALELAPICKVYKRFQRCKYNVLLVQLDWNKENNMKKSSSQRQFYWDGDGTASGNLQHA